MYSFSMYPQVAKCQARIAQALRPGALWLSQAFAVVAASLAGNVAADALRPLEGAIDQRAHIQAALDALPAGRNFLAELKLEGRFVLHGPLLLDSWTRIDLRNARLELHSTTPDSVIANRNGKEGGEIFIEILGGTIVGNRKFRGMAGAGCIEFYRASRVSIEGVTVNQCAMDGILLSGRGQRTYGAVLRDITVQGNLRNGLMVMWAMRNVRVDSVVARHNGKHGVVSDHSESEYNNIRATRNGSDGIFIRNVFHNGYHNLFATNNGRHGIRVLGLVESSGRGWHAFNNGRRRELGTAADVFFTSEALSYGITRDTRIEGLLAGDSNWAPAGSAAHALLVEPARDEAEDYQNLGFRGAILKGSRSLPKSTGVEVVGS